MKLVGSAKSVRPSGVSTVFTTPKKPPCGARKATGVPKDNFCAPLWCSSVGRSGIRRREEAPSSGAGGLASRPLHFSRGFNIVISTATGFTSGGLTTVLSLAYVRVSYLIIISVPAPFFGWPFFAVGFFPGLPTVFFQISKLLPIEHIPQKLWEPTSGKRTVERWFRETRETERTSKDTLYVFDLIIGEPLEIQLNSFTNPPSSKDVVLERTLPAGPRYGHRVSAVVYRSIASRWRPSDRAR